MLVHTALWLAAGVVLLFVGLVAFGAFASGVRIACESVADWHHRSPTFAWLLEHWFLWVAACVIAALVPGMLGPMSWVEAIGAGFLIVGVPVVVWFGLRRVLRR